MTLSELESAVRQALAAGRIGTPVALSMHLQMPPADVDLGVWLALLVTKFGVFLNDEPDRVLAQQANSSRQWSVLVSGKKGRNATFVLGNSSVDSPTIHFVLHGNHGTIELNGEQLETEPFTLLPEAAHWSSLVMRSAEERRAVPVE